RLIRGTERVGEVEPDDRGKNGALLSSKRVQPRLERLDRGGRGAVAHAHAAVRQPRVRAEDRTVGLLRVVGQALRRAVGSREIAAAELDVDEQAKQASGAKSVSYEIVQRAVDHHRGKVVLATREVQPRERLTDLETVR